VSSWPALRSTLDAVAARGEEIRFWWRDDDAGRADPALDRVLDLARRQGAPLALAVVARWLEEDAQDAIAANDRVTVLQHGWAHDNAAPEGAKSVELGHRPVETLLEELVRGRAMLEEAFGTLFMAVLVPPWNRIDPALIGRLGEAGYVGLSTFGRRRAAATTNGLAQVNAHLDPVDWRGSRLFIGTGAALERLTLAIEGVEEPIGVLTHHLVMDEAGWTFVERLLEELGRHPGARLCDARELFGGPG
jgi:peptidoglycan/xylan/chitin deacetylase (PgdA/CDA1 family)